VQETNDKVRDKCFLSSDLCVSLRLISRSTVDGTRLRCHSRSWRSSVCQDFSGFPRRCWKRVSRTHSSGSRRSNDDVRSIAIQYRYLRSFRREPGKHVSASYVFHALEHPDIYRIHDLVSHPPVLCSPYEIPIFHLTQKHNAFRLYCLKETLDNINLGFKDTQM